MRKRVLLLMPNYSSIYEMIIDNLQVMGYDAVYHDIGQFKYENNRQKIYNFLRKTLLNDKNYKNYLKAKYVENDIVKSFDKSDVFFDYILIIHPCEYSIDTISYLKNMSSKIVAYHWEGFSRFNVPKELISKFDVFGVFDKKDYENNVSMYPNMRYVQSFYFDFIDNVSYGKYDLLYIGANLFNRLDKLKHLTKISRGKKTYFQLYSKKEGLSHSIIKFSNQLMSYRKTLEISSKSKCVIDIKLPMHNGLSLRFFEALYFNQKIITDNKIAKEIDFYHPNNILIVDDFENLSEKDLDNFLKKEYKEIPNEIKEKYSFENWFNTIIK